MAELRTAPGMRERAPGVWELIVEAGRDPVTGKRRQVSRTFRGNLRDAKKARAALLVDVGKGRHTGARATLDDLFAEWIIELRRKGRSPNTVRGYELVYERNIKPTLGSMPVTKVTTKTLTDLYGAHQARGLAARSVYQVHACLSSMFTQACRWGWRDSNPAQWADPPSIPNTEPTVPTPEEVRLLIAEAERGKRPEMARAILVAATTGLRRAELCALHRGPRHTEIMAFIDLAFDRMMSKGVALGPSVSDSPNLDGANSVFSLVVHCIGVAEWWCGHVILGRPTSRDRDAEFAASGTITELESLVKRFRSELPALIEEVAQTPEPLSSHIESATAEYREWPWTTASIILHVIEELFQHAGHVDVMADLLTAEG